MALTAERDSEERFEQAMAILAAPEQASDARRAVALIDQAAEAGHAAAAERRAVFEAMGVGRPAHWDNGLDWLAKAAERGSASAGRQLLVLAENRFEAELPAGQPDGFWSEARAAISADRCFRPPVGRTLVPRPLIRSIDKFASPAECEWLITAAAPRLERAIIYELQTGAQTPDPARTNLAAPFLVPGMDLVVEMIRRRICAAIGVSPPHLEASQVLHYSVGQEFKPHYDFLDPAADTVRRDGQRAVTVLIYLNEDFDGGQTRFPNIGFEFRGSAGDAMIFANVDPAGRPDPATLHTGVPPTSGEKWIFSQWVRDRPMGTAG